MASPTGNGGLGVHLLPLRYIANDQDSARQLVLAQRPDWKTSESVIEFVRFTDGITNTLLKAVNRRPGLSNDEIDNDAILLRAYGPGTDILIDRQREAQNHELLMHYGLAPELLARFENGMLYRFVRGTVSRPDDLRRPDISAAVARCLAQWHAIVPCIPESSHGNGSGMSRIDSGHPNGKLAGTDDGDSSKGSQENGSGSLLVSGKPEPNLWSVIQKWVFALPTDTEAQRQRRALLWKEFQELVATLGQRPGLGRNGLVFAHNDLLSGNIIILPDETSAQRNGNECKTAVTFIDYEYAVPAPVAFDIANHFAEWGGFDCDMGAMPTVSQRRAFVLEYVQAFSLLSPSLKELPGIIDVPLEAAKLLEEVDVFRGVPGFYWGVWALIQATISDIDFDYASYAETRLAEYWAWKAEVNGTRLASGAEMPLRERRWAQEADEPQKAQDL